MIQTCYIRLMSIISKKRLVINMKYILIPFFAWIVSGILKFTINSLRFGKKARGLIGYGGFPSTHTTILSSVVFLCGFIEGFDTPIFSLGLGVLLILIIDAHGLRNKIGSHARAINILQQKDVDNKNTPLRERMGHSWIEIIGGLLLGSVLAFFISLI